MVSSNRRRRRRVMLSRLAQIAQEDAATGERRESMGKTADVSEGGVRFHGREVFDPFRQVEVAFALGESIIEARGTVRHLTINKRGTVAMGIEFVDLSPEDQDFIKQYCCEREAL